MTAREPRAAHLHVIPRTIRPLQHALVRLFRRYFEQAPGWVLLTTTGRRTGVPCERWADAVMVISTYGTRSDWLRNIRKDPRVRITAAGWVLAGRAEIVDDRERKRALVSAHPFFPPAPFGLLNWLHRTVLRPLAVAFLRWWVGPRPVVVIRPERV
jgi:deazaflavin-dependent oxidoreductase (nitroreductase family)